MKETQRGTGNTSTTQRGRSIHRLVPGHRIVWAQISPSDLFPLKKYSNNDIIGKKGRNRNVVVREGQKQLSKVALQSYVAIAQLLRSAAQKCCFLGQRERLWPESRVQYLDVKLGVSLIENM